MALRSNHTITPALVGRRITLQYELPNGFVSEVVGELKWYDKAADTYMVEDRHGTLHRVPAKGIRHGRAVTPG